MNSTEKENKKKKGAFINTLFISSRKDQTFHLLSRTFRIFSYQPAGSIRASNLQHISTAEVDSAPVDERTLKSPRVRNRFISCLKLWPGASPHVEKPRTPFCTKNPMTQVKAREVEVGEFTVHYEPAPYRSTSDARKGRIATSWMMTVALTIHAHPRPEDKGIGPFFSVCGTASPGQHTAVVEDTRVPSGLWLDMRKR